MVSLELLERSDSASGSAAVMLAHAIGLEASLTRPLTRDDWLDVVRDTQALINVLTGIQDVAIAEAARRESIWTEDGTLGELVHSPGRVAIDAADLVAPLIAASHAQAQNRVEAAVKVAAAITPVPAEMRVTPTPNGLEDLQRARLDGRLDSYRAGVLAGELEAAPPEVARTVVEALDAHLGDDAPTLRRHCRRLLARISPDLLKQRAARARASTGLRRWVSEPGVDTWVGTFPSEEAATAWAAIDARAHELVAAGTCTTVEQARGRALTDLVIEHANVDVQVVLTVPADDPRAAGSAPAPKGPGATAPASLTPSPTPDAPAPVVARSGTAKPTEVAAEPFALTAEAITGDDLVEVQGARPSEPLLVSRAWLAARLADRPAALATCHPTTGALLATDQPASPSYRPSPGLAALVRKRDGRCRFPGCSVAARFCDLDHVRPWPTGPTSDTNLLTLCRRHHRIKQRPGWLLRLAPDGLAHWTDPTGRTRTTSPLDALGVEERRTDDRPR